MKNNKRICNQLFYEISTFFRSFGASFEPLQDLRSIIDCKIADIEVLEEFVLSNIDFNIDCVGHHLIFAVCPNNISKESLDPLIKGIISTVKRDLNKTEQYYGKNYEFLNNRKGCFQLILFFKDVKSSLIFSNSKTLSIFEGKEIRNISLYVKNKYQDAVSKIWDQNVVNKPEIVLKTMSSSDGKIFEVKIDNRANSIYYPFLGVNSESPILTYNYCANLFDLVEIYNKKSDMLFQHNLRYGLTERQDVNDSICTTLIQCPEQFYFLNNGITFCINENEFSYNKYNYLKFTSNSVLFSVVNGAQTITTASEFFYSEDQKKLVDCAKEKAYVLLRVIVLKEKAELKEKSIIEKVTIALNRQKPIKPEDITYTIPFVNRINSLNKQIEENSFSFELIRRGAEESVIYHQYLLTSFAQIVASFLAQDPGEARRDKTALLLTQNDEKSLNSVRFSKQEIFCEQEMLNNEELTTEEYEDYFYKRYKPVNFAMSMLETVNDNSIQIIKNLNDSPDVAVQNFMKYGKYHLVAFCVLFESDHFEDIKAARIVDDLVISGRDYSAFSHATFDSSCKSFQQLGNIVDSLVKAWSKVNTKLAFETNDFKGDKNWANVVFEASKIIKE